MDNYILCHLRVAFRYYCSKITFQPILNDFTIKILIDQRVALEFTLIKRYTVEMLETTDQVRGGMRHMRTYLGEISVFKLINTTQHIIIQPVSLVPFSIRLIRHEYVNDLSLFCKSAAHTPFVHSPAQLLMRKSCKFSATASGEAARIIRPVIARRQIRQESEDVVRGRRRATWVSKTAVKTAVTATGGREREERSGAGGNERRWQKRRDASWRTSRVARSGQSRGCG